MEENSSPSLFIALPTPFDDRGQIDSKALAHLVEYSLSQEISGLVVLTEAAEDPLLSPKERRHIIEWVSKARKSEAPFWVNISAPATREAVDLAKSAAEQGAEALLIGPYRVPGIGYRELYRHVDRVHRSVSLPVYLVSRPEAPVSALAPEERATLMQHPGVAGIFCPEGSTERLRAMGEGALKANKGFFSGSSLSFAEHQKAGAHGVICALALVAIDLANATFQAVAESDPKALDAIRRRARPVLELLGPPRAHEDQSRVQKFATKLAKRSLAGSRLSPSVPFPLIKETLRLQGHPVHNYVRAPYEPVSSEDSARLKAVLKNAGLIS